jgi:galactose oxidase
MIQGHSSVSGSIAVEGHCEANTFMGWSLRPVNGQFEIVEQHDNQCLTVLDPLKSPNAAVTQQACAGLSNQLWTVTPSGNSYQVGNSYSGLCLSEGPHVQGVTTLVQNACSTADSTKLWVFGSGLVMPATPVNLLATHSGQCLNNQASTTPGGAIVQYPCAGAVGTPAEQWSLQPTGSSYEVVSTGSGLCLSVSGSSVLTGAAVIQDTCAGSPNQLWNPTPFNGAYQLAAASGIQQCLTVAGASQTASGTVDQEPCAETQNQLWALNVANSPSQWSGVITLPIIPIAVSNLPDGKLLTWSADQITTFYPTTDVNTQTYYSIFDPATNTSTESLETNLLTDMFCPGTAQLPDGRLLVNGGITTHTTSIYDPTTSTWVADAKMNIGRGYEGDTLLSNGSVFSMGGSFSGGTGNKTGEVWTEGQGWTLLSSLTDDTITGPDPRGAYRGDNHAWFFAVGGGQVFHAGPTAEMHWINPTGTGTITSLGNRGDDEFSINGKAVMYDVGHILKTGGAAAYDSGPANANTYDLFLNNIDSNQGVTVTKLAPMAYPRAMVNAVVLPDGEIVIAGGMTVALTFSDLNAVLTPEIWDPVTKVFHQMTPMQTPRNYHSVAILMTDGRVWVGGGGQCGSCAYNHFNAEILTPPYLLNADGSPATRPSILTSPASAALGGTVNITTDSPVASFSLIWFSSVTHSVNSDQRRIPLTVTSNTTSKNYVVTIPSDPGIALPGNYMLFALDVHGVPSLAQAINLHQ